MPNSVLNSLGVTNQKVGVSGGVKIGSIFLPGNDILKDYKIANSSSLFRFKCSAFRSPEMSIQTKKEGNKNTISVMADTVPEPLAEFEFIYNQESFSLNHSHRWNEPRGLIGRLKALFDEGVGGFSGGDILAVIEGGNQLLQKGDTSIRTDWNAFGSLDLAKSYQGTDAPDIPISFVLFTTTDPLIDVVIPATFLTYISYPRLKKGRKELTELLNIVDGFVEGNDPSNIRVENSVNLKEKERQQENKAADKAASGMIDELKQAFRTIKDASSDKWRYRLGYAPPTWVVSASNGLVHMNNAALVNVQVTYHGPWIGTKAIKGKLSDDLSKEIYGASKGGQSSGGEVSIGGFPSWAEVTLTFRNNFEQVFGEEWMMGIAGSASHYSQVTTEINTEENQGVALKVAYPSPPPEPPAIP
jgi:hypothetical protein